MTTTVIPHLKALGCVVSACGSRITCDPAPANTDEDYLVFCGSEDIVGETVSCLLAAGFEWEGANEHYQEVARNTFMSWRSADQVNLIVTSSEDFRDRHHAATAICKRLNLLNKPDRIAVFQAVLYGSIHSDG